MTTIEQKRSEVYNRLIKEKPSQTEGGHLSIAIASKLMKLEMKASFKISPIID